MAARWLYLPGLGTGTRTRKGALLAEALAARGEALTVIDARLPHPALIRLSAVVAAALAALPQADTSAFVVGTSLGGAAGAALAARAPSLAGVVLLAPALHLGGFPWGQPWLGWLAAVGVPYLDRQDHRLRWLDRSFFADAAALDPAGQPPRCPVLVVHGRDDRRVPLAASRAYAARHAGIELLEVDDGHDLFRVWPEVEGRILAFAAQCSIRQSDRVRGETGSRRS
jgi:pimeloyl-ACP methyl ester carboxylesterase